MNCQAQNSHGFCQMTAPCQIGQCRYAGHYVQIVTNTTKPQHLIWCNASERTPIGEGICICSRELRAGFNTRESP